MLFQPKSLFAAAMVCVLAACSAGQETGDRGSIFTANENLNKLKGSPVQGSPFAQQLRFEYQRLADEEVQVSRDYIDADFYAKKGLRAAMGQEVMPENPTDWAVGAAARPAMNAARIRLINALDNGGREQEPRLSAFTQARYDCWLEQQEEAYQADHISRCQQEFGALIAKLERKLTEPEPAPQPVVQPAVAPPPPPVPAPAPVVTRQAERRLFVVLFDFDSAELSNDAAAAITYVAGKLRAWPGGKALVVGHTDRAGSSSYNLTLSQLRASKVMQALEEAGAPANKVSLTWAGEDSPAIATEDGAREQANRRVVIVLDELGRP